LLGVERRDPQLGAAGQRARTKLSAADISRALTALPPQRRPRVVHVVREIPVTTWYRPLTGPLRRAGLPRASRRAWYRDGEQYKQLTSEVRARLLKLGV